MPGREQSTSVKTMTASVRSQIERDVDRHRRLEGERVDPCLSTPAPGPRPRLSRPSSTLSRSSCLTIRPREAPSARRTPISRAARRTAREHQARDVARIATSSTSPTTDTSSAVNADHRAANAREDARLRLGGSTVATRALSVGYCAREAPCGRRSSRACASAGVRPDFKRPVSRSPTVAAVVEPVAAGMRQEPRSRTERTGRA